MTVFSARAGAGQGAKPGHAQVFAVATLALILPVALGFAVTFPAQAQQQGAPQSLAPQSLAPKPLTLPAPVAVTSAPPAEASTSGIRIDTLGELDANSVGLLDASAGGLGIRMWKGTPRSLVETVLPSLPGAPQSMAGRDLYRRLLLSAAETPAGPPGKGLPSLVAMRVGRLLAQGDVVSAQGLLRIVPRRLDEASIVMARAEVAFLMNDNAGACSDVGANLGRQPGIFWREAQVFCQLLAGDTAGANIGAGLLQEQGVMDAPFFALARMLAGDKGVAVNGLEKPSPLHLAMMRAARVQVPPAVVTDGAPAVLRAVALAPNADLDTRLEAAEQAEMRGALDADTLRQIYLSVNFTPEELSGALSTSEKLSGPRGRALLYRAARGQKVASAQAEILSRAFALARKHGRLPTAVRVFEPVLAGIEPGDDLAWFAVEAGRASYVVGAFEAAAKWLALATAKPTAGAERSGDASKENAVRLPNDLALWPMAQIVALARVPEANSAAAAAVPANGPTAAVAPGAVVIADTGTPALPVDDSRAVFDMAAFDRWWQAAAVLGSDVRAQRAARLLALSEALGARVGDDAWARLITAPAPGPVTLPSPGLMAGLDHAAAAGRVGETVLLALKALGTDAPSKVDIRVLAPVVRALKSVSFDIPARQLVVESLFDDLV